MSLYRHWHRCAGAARQILMKALINVNQTLAAGVNNAHLLEHRQKLRCISQRFFGSGQDFGHQLCYIRCTPRVVDCMSGSFLGDSKYRSLYRLDHRFVGCIHSGLQRCCELLRVQFIILGCIPSKASEQL
ncbi:hypothetical protein D3C73_961650 [compost metagenome]